MKVNGSEFKRVREFFKYNKSKSKRRNRDYGHKPGTQAWLSDLAGIDVKTIQNLESGAASLETIEAVSEALSINGYQYIYGYGESHVRCGANKSIDFRPLEWVSPPSVVKLRA